MVLQKQHHHHQQQITAFLVVWIVALVVLPSRIQSFTVLPKQQQNRPWSSSIRSSAVTVALQETTDEAAAAAFSAPAVAAAAEFSAPVVAAAESPTTTTLEIAETAVAPVEAAAAAAATPLAADVTTTIPEIADATTPVAPAPTTTTLPNTYVKCGKCQTVYALTETDLGEKGRGRRLECSVCSHSWFQSKDRLMTMKDGFEMVALPKDDLDRIQVNMEEGKSPSFMGDVKLYVGNIAFECHEDDIQEIFAQVGTVGDVSLVRDELGRIRGFGFVTMRTKEDGDKAIAELDGMTLRGRKIAVRESTN